jgi:GT2 family glycosyltransferase
MTPTGTSPDCTSSDAPPILTRIVDLREDLPTINRNRQDGPPFTGARIFVLDDGVPLGVVHVSFEEDVITPELLRCAIDSQLDVPQTKSPRSDRSADDLPRASVVIPTTFGRFDQLESCVQALVELNHPNFEIIVVDNRPHRPGAADERAKIGGYEGVVVVTEEVPGISAARNAGSAAATGEIVAFTDDDVIPHRNWLRSLGATLARNKDVDYVAGLVVPSELETRAQLWFEDARTAREQREFVPYIYRSMSWNEPDLSAFSTDRYLVRRTDLGGDSVVHPIYLLAGYGRGCNFAVRRKTLQELGGFDRAIGAGTRAKGGEDIAFRVDLLFSGRSIAFDPGAIVCHTHRRTDQELSDQMFDYGVGFSAALSSLAMRDPRHIIGYFQAYWFMTTRGRRRFEPTASALAASERKDLRRRERNGKFAGPALYLRSRRDPALRRRPSPANNAT